MSTMGTPIFDAVCDDMELIYGFRVLGVYVDPEAAPGQIFPSESGTLPNLYNISKTGDRHPGFMPTFVEEHVQYKPPPQEWLASGVPSEAQLIQAQYRLEKQIADTEMSIFYHSGADWSRDQDILDQLQKAHTAFGQHDRYRGATSAATIAKASDEPAHEVTGEDWPDGEE